jgi:hypothetical protein
LVLKHQAKATQLVWVNQPGSGTSGNDLESYPALALKDAYGNIVTNDNSDTVTLSLYSQNGAVLQGTTTVTLVDGTAYFVNLKVDRAGSGYVLVPSSNISGISITGSNAFSVSESSTPTKPFTWAGGWTDIGPGADLVRATGIAVDKDFNVYACDQSGQLDANMNVYSFAREYRQGSWYLYMNTLYAPSGVAVDSSGANVYIADSYHYRVLKNQSPLGSLPGGFIPYGVQWTAAAPCIPPAAKMC